MRVEVGYSGEPILVRFLGRPNRFLARVRRATGGPAFDVHVPNPGRMEELLVAGMTLGFVVSASGIGRRTSYDLTSVRHGRTLVSVDSRIANRLVAGALRSGALVGFARLGWSAEVAWGPHRFDFARREAGSGTPVELLEVKSSNLRVGTTALFPDAPTERGRRHLLELARASRAGIRASVLFAVQRSDVRRFRPNRELDPAFGAAFDLARQAGVRMVAVRLRVRPGGVTLDRRIPIPHSGKGESF